MEIYQDSQTVLTVNGDMLLIDHNGRRICEASRLEVGSIGGSFTEGSGFINPGDVQPVTDVIIETLSGPVVHLKVPADGDGVRLMTALTQFREDIL